MSVPTALGLLALATAVTALLATLGVYQRLRILEQGVTELAYTAGPVSTAVPEPVRPHAGQAVTLAAVVDGDCPLCHQVLAWLPRAAAAVPGGARVVAVTPPGGVAVEPPTEVVDDPATWRGLYDGFTPVVTVVGPTGRVTDRIFVYADTDLETLTDRLRRAADSTADPTADPRRTP